MLALTIWQPWASLIASGIKLVENRDWARRRVLGQRIAIHAGKFFDEDAADDLAVTFLEDSAARSVIGDARIHRGEIIATAVVDRFITSVPPGAPATIAAWFIGEYGWVLRDVRRFDPIVCRGAQGLWEVPREVMARIPEDAR